MNHAIQFDLEQSRKRLEYYVKLKEQSRGSAKTIDKWIEIYSDRVKKTESSAARLGLKTKLDASVPTKKSRAH